MSNRYPIPSGRQRVEEEIKKSRFVTTVEAVASVEEARAFVDEMRAEFTDASHNCWAYLVGPPGTTTHVGMSDDGEPHNSAGRPMLTVLPQCGLGDIAAVVTRYWGGTKLGKGGLVRAYSGGVQLALASSGTAERVDWVEISAAFDYAAVTGFKRTVAQFEAEIQAEDYGEKALFRLKLPSDHVAGLQIAVTELTNGQVVFEPRV